MATPDLAAFFNHHHDKLLCTASRDGLPNVSLMGTPRMQDDGTIAFEISDRISTTLTNIRENPAVLFMAYVPGPRARDYAGVRIYAEVTAIEAGGPAFEAIRERIRAKFGDEKADELQATVTCAVTRVRPVVDRGQAWDEPPFPEAVA